MFVITCQNLQFEFGLSMVHPGFAHIVNTNITDLTSANMLYSFFWKWKDTKVSTLLFPLMSWYENNVLYVYQC